VPGATIVLLAANVVYATSYAVTRLVLPEIGPATVAFMRLVLGALLLLPLAIAGERTAMDVADRRRVFLMGVIGFAAAIMLGNWGIARSTATNAALLITVEPLTLILLSPALLGETLSRRERVGAALSVIGAVLVMVNGVPGVTARVVPHWRGDLFLVLSGFAYAAYTLLGRDVLRRHPALPVTARSIAWGAVGMAPLAVAEWAAGVDAAPGAGAIVGVLYLGLVVTALAYLAWNYAVERMPAPRVAIFLNVQPLCGALLGAWWLGEPLTVFTAIGGVLVLAGLQVAARAGA
jgi:drug/metabolite transporter (DMT)-like permease